MRIGPILRRASLVALVPVISGAVPACSGVFHPEPAEAGALRDQYPAEAGRILDATMPFTSTREGFVLDLPEGLETAAEHGGLHVLLPKAADAPVRFELPRGFTIHVHELDAHGDGALAAGAVTYARPGGSAFWSASDRGFEEWLMLDATATHADRALAAWQVSGAILRKVGDDIQIADDNGVPQLKVSAPVAYTSSGRRVEPSLLLRGHTIELWAPVEGEALLVDPAWQPMATMSKPRRLHGSALFSNGKVLIVGGSTTGGALEPSAELYDPVANTWAAAGTLTTARSAPTTTLLVNGKVLVTGGAKSDGPVLSSTEIYDPATNAWSAGPAMTTVRAAHVATALTDGRVLVSGGVGVNTYLKTTELYDPIANKWTAGPAMTDARYAHISVRLADGRVLVALSRDVAVTSADIFDPTTNTMKATAAVSFGRSNCQGILLPSGKVLIGGGYDSIQQPSTLGDAVLYDPAAGTWANAGAVGINIQDYAFAPFPNGKAILTGGFYGSTQKTTRVFDPAADVWSAGPTLTAARSNHTADALGDGSVFLAGGQGPFGAVLASTEYLSNANKICASNGDCLSGFCADGVCCDTACDAGPCDACSVAAGAAVDGTCKLITGPVCDDGNACTQSDTCQAGVCTGTNPIGCVGKDACNDAACNPGTGACDPVVKADGTACDDGDACTKKDVCTAGVCAGGSVTCAALDQCHAAGVCDSANGTCSNPTLPDGSPCSIGVCAAGLCIASGTGTGGGGTGGAGSGGGGAGGMGTGGMGTGGTGTGGGAGGMGTGGTGTGGMGTGGAIGTGGAMGTGGMGAGGAMGTGGSGGSATEAGSTGSGTSSGAVVASEGNGCGCGVAGSRAAGGLWLGLGLLLAARRRRSAQTDRRSSAA